MGQNQAIVLGLLAAPVLVLMLLRINATMVFLSLCLGYVVMQFLGADAKTFADVFMTHAAVSTNIMQLGLLLFPAIFTTLFMIRTVRGAKLVMNILPAVAVGSLTVLFVVPLLPPGTSHAITGLRLWQEAIRLQDIIVGAGALVSLLFLWTQRPRRDKEERGKR
jgi:hypothetical protein